MSQAGSLQTPASSTQDPKSLSSETPPLSAVDNTQNPVDLQDVVRGFDLLHGASVPRAHLGLLHSTPSLVMTTGGRLSPAVTGANLLDLHGVLSLE